MRRRVIAYVTRERDRRRELLVFDDPEHPHMGVQLPAGRLDEHESLEEGLARELEEETGLTGTRVVRRLCDPNEFIELYGTSRYANYAFEVVAAEAPDAWDHEVLGAGDDAGLVFRCRFVPIAPELRLFGRPDPLLARLLA
jgi:8-oxo-dGTP pyrophosphatase MutT (NUDIX family)